MNMTVDLSVGFVPWVIYSLVLRRQTRKTSANKSFVTYMKCCDEEKIQKQLQLVEDIKLAWACTSHSLNMACFNNYNNPIVVLITFLIKCI